MGFFTSTVIVSSLKNRQKRYRKRRREAGDAGLDAYLSKDCRNEWDRVSDAIGSVKDN